MSNDDKKPQDPKKSDPQNQKQSDQKALQVPTKIIPPRILSPRTGHVISDPLTVQGTFDDPATITVRLLAGTTEKHSGSVMIPGGRWSITFQPVDPAVDTIEAFVEAGPKFTVRNLTLMAPPHVKVTSATVTDNPISKIRTMAAAGEYVDRPAGKIMEVRVFDHEGNPVGGLQFATFLTTTTWSIGAFLIPRNLAITDYAVEAMLSDFAAGMQTTVAAASKATNL